MTALLESPGAIQPDAVYTKDEFCRRVQWKQHAWRGARRNGLKVVETAGHVYVKGQAFFDYLDAIATNGDA